MNSKFLFVVVITTIAVLENIAQPLTIGGLQGEGHLLLTPSADENKSLKNKNIRTLPQWGFKENERSFEFSPQLKDGWNWVAAFNIPVKGKRINTFYYDGWVGTDQPRIITNGRRRNFDEDITSKTKSNAYHIAFHRKQLVENEMFLFIISPKKQTTKIEIDPAILGVARTLEYNMDELEAKFVHIIIPPEEFTQVTWQPEKTDAETIDISKDWRFSKGDHQGAERMDYDISKWENLSLPHTWNTSDLFDYRNFKDTIDVTTMIWRGTGWYRKEFHANENWKNKYVKVNFLGANQVAEIYVNGKLAGKHVGGYTDFHFDISQHLDFGKPNLLAVKVDNRFDYDIPPHTADYNLLGGIYREAQIMVLNPIFISKVKVVTPEVSPTSASVKVTATLGNKSTIIEKVRLITNIINPYNEIIASKIKDIEVKPGTKTGVEIVFPQLSNPLLWSPDFPNLYRVSTTLYEPSSTIQANGVALDQRFNYFGFRFYSFDAAKGLTFNGRPLKLYGVNVHQDFMHQGWAVEKKQKKEDFIHIKNMGANFVRLSHYPHHPYTLHLCDSLGLIAWAEIPVVNTVGKDKFIERAVKMMDEMITRDINHPSIIMWGVGNEYYRSFFNKEDAGYALKSTEMVAQKVRELDPYRPTVQAQNDLVDDRIMNLTDLQGRNRYIGWYEKSYNDFETEMLHDHQQHPQWKLLVSEYGAEGKYGYHVSNPSLFDHSETYQVNLHKVYRQVIEKHEFIIGSAIWNMFDFASWGKVGNIPHINQKGMMTYDRKPKSVYYYYQSHWSQKPMVYIYSHTWTHRGGKKDELQPVEIFSNCNRVELFVNGKSAGTIQEKNNFVWNVKYDIGTNKVKAVGHKDGEVVSSEMQIIFYEDNPTSEIKKVQPKGDN